MMKGLSSGVPACRQRFAMFLLALSVALPAAAKHPKEAYTAFAVGDTVYYDADYGFVKPKKADMCGVVRRIDEPDSVATIQVFDKNCKTLIAVLKRVAAGRDFNRRKGKQLYFRPDGTVERMEVYTLIHDGATTWSKRTSETLLHANGKVKEEVVATIKNENLSLACERRCYDEEGLLFCLETWQDSKLQTSRYYDKDGHETDTPETTVEPLFILPEFPGGQTQLLTFLSTRVQYPANCQREGIQGRVICEFHVSKKGDIEDVRVLRSGGHKSLDREAVRVVKSMPRWKPGKERGKPVRVKFTVPVNFQLH